MAGEFKVNGVSFATESGGTLTVNNSKVRLPSSGNGIEDSSGNSVLSESGGKTSINLTGDFVPSEPMMFRNRIINGDMRIAQRGTSFSTNNVRNFGVDRFACNASANTTITFSQSTDAPSGFTNSLLATVTSANSSITAGDTNYILQVIEGYNIADLNFGTSSAKNFTISFYVKSSLTGSFGIGFASNNNDRVYHTNYTINSANTWEHKTIQVSGPTSGTWLTNNGVGLMPLWDLGLGTDFESNTTNVWDSNNDYRRSTDVNLSLNAGATWQITGVQLEVGNQATPFEHRPIGTELSLCQRYFEKSYNLDVVPGTSTQEGSFRTLAPRTLSNTTDYMYSVQYKVTKRAGTDLIIYSTDGTQGVVRDISGANNTTIRTSLGGASNLMTGFDISDTRFYAFQWTASAEL